MSRVSIAERSAFSEPSPSHIAPFCEAPQGSSGGPTAAPEHGPRTQAAASIPARRSERCDIFVLPDFNNRNGFAASDAERADRRSGGGVRVTKRSGPVADALHTPFVETHVAGLMRDPLWFCLWGVLPAGALTLPLPPGPSPVILE